MRSYERADPHAPCLLCPWLYLESEEDHGDVSATELAVINMTFKVQIRMDRSSSRTERHNFIWLSYTLAKMNVLKACVAASLFVLAIYTVKV